MINTLIQSPAPDLKATTGVVNGLLLCVPIYSILAVLSIAAVILL